MLLFAFVNGNLRGMMPTELTVSLNARVSGITCILSVIRDSPNANEFDVDIDGKCFFECLALLPAFHAIFIIHSVRERDLLVVASW